MHDDAVDPLEAFRRVNTAGTEHLARSAAASGVKRLVFVSSVKVNGESTSSGSSLEKIPPSPPFHPQGVRRWVPRCCAATLPQAKWGTLRSAFSEKDEANPQDPYGVSKWEAEQALHRVAKETGLEVVIVRPPLVYGAGVKGNFAQMLKVLAKGIPLPLASVSNLRSLVYIGNFVDALLCSTSTHIKACVIYNRSYNGFNRSKIYYIMLASLLFGTYRQRVLGLLLLNPGRSYYVREIARLTDTAAGTLHKELARLAGVGLLVRENVGNQVRYSANRDCPVFEELASILRKTSGLVDVLAEVLCSVKNQISLAFVFGSLARGEQQLSSDVDVMLVGGLGFVDVVQLLHPAQETLQREINPVVYSLDEFNRRITSGDSFMREVLSNPKLFIVGNEDELRKLTQNQAAPAA